MDRSISFPLIFQPLSALRDPIDSLSSHSPATTGIESIYRFPFSSFPRHYGHREHLSFPFLPFPSHYGQRGTLSIPSPLIFTHLRASRSSFRCLSNFYNQKKSQQRSELLFLIQNYILSFFSISISEAAESILFLWSISADAMISSLFEGSLTSA